MLGGEADPRRQAERLEEYFHEQFTYSLQTDLAGPEHPLLILLRERRPASCTYFAAAYTLLLRTRGVPARVVTGYLSPPVNRLTGGVTLREIDAHAWAEVYLASEQRWVGFDPTPADSRQAVYAPVQGGGWWGEVWGAVTVWARRAWLAWRRDPLGATARGMIWPLGGLLLGWLSWRVGRRLVTRRGRLKVGGGLEADDPVLRASRREFEASLGRLGLLVDPTESDEERLQRLAGMTSVEVCARAGRFLEQYHAARFGGREPTADLLAQAEHDESAQSILITDDPALAEAVVASVERHLSTLSRKEIAGASWRDYGAIIMVKKLSDALPLADRIAAEHLEIISVDAEDLAARVSNAGAIFIGGYTPEAVGDYVGGSNHVLPTARSARFSSGLSVLDFLKRTSILKCDAESLRAIGAAAVTLGEAEGLTAHARSVSIRLNQLGD